MGDVLYHDVEATKDEINRVHFETHSFSDKRLVRIYCFRLKGKGKREKMDRLKLQFSLHRRGLVDALFEVL